MFYTDGIHLVMDWLDWAPDENKLTPLHEFAHSIGLGKKDFYHVRCYPHYKINPQIILEHIDKMNLISSGDYTLLINKPGRLSRTKNWKPNIISDEKEKKALMEYERLFKFLKRVSR